MSQPMPRNGNEAIGWLHHPRVPDEVKARLRAAVYAEFDVMYEEASGKRKAPNQSVIDMLERAKGSGEGLR